MNRNRTALLLWLIGLILVSGIVIPVKAAQNQQVAGPMIQVIPQTAAPAARVTVQGMYFERASGPVIFYWDSLESFPIGNAESVSNGSFINIATIPPDADPGLHILFAFDLSTQTYASTEVTIIGEPKRGLYIFATDENSARGFQTLLGGRGMLDLDVITLDRLSGVDFSKYGLIIIGADTGYWDSKELAPELIRLLRSKKPVFALGAGGFEAFNRMNLQNGRLQRLEVLRSGISIPDQSLPLFKTPYSFSTGGLALYREPMPLTAMEIPEPVHHVVRLGDVPDSKSAASLVTEERRFLLWGFSASPGALTTEGEKLIINAAWELLQYNPEINTLIIVDYNRMFNLGYSAADVELLQNQINTLVALPKSQSHMVAKVLDLGTTGRVLIHTARANWIYEGATPGITSVSITNNYVNAIDQHIEYLKKSLFPNLEYLIIVGSHEVIPMKAREADDMSDHKESNWAAGLPAGVLSYNYFKSLYQDPGTIGYGHYLTDTIYSDLSYVINGQGVDDELIPELGVGRLVETPAQISKLVDNYMANSGHLTAGPRASIASNDYMDGGQAAANILGPQTDTSLIQNTFDTNLVPDVINDHNAFVYLAGHGNYNSVSPGFKAGSDDTRGDTEELSMLTNSVVVTSGCHNGVNFGNMRYHDYTGNTTYGEFPERMSNLGVGVYLGATGYTWISGTGASTDPVATGWNEKLAVDFIKHLLQDGSAASPGRAIKSSVDDYLSGSPGWDYTRRVISIATLYGFPTYGPPMVFISSAKTTVYGYSLNLKWVSQGISLAESSLAANQDISLEVNDWSVNSEGLVTIPGASYSSGGDVPILPLITTSQLFPPGTQIGTIVWDEAASQSTTITNDVPLFPINVNGDPIPNTFTSSDFYPSSPFSSSQTSSMGDGGVNLTLVINPVQYNQATHQTRIWTQLVFHVTYDIDTVSADVDTDADGLPDFWETAYGMSPSSDVGNDGPAGDLDGDGLSNEEELALGTDPSNPDSDSDGKTDGEEAADGTNPLNPGDRKFNVFLPLVKR